MPYTELAQNIKVQHSGKPSGSQPGEHDTNARFTEERWLRRWLGW